MNKWISNLATPSVVFSEFGYNNVIVIYQVFNFTMLLFLLLEDVSTPLFCSTLNIAAALNVC